MSYRPRLRSPVARAPRSTLEDCSKDRSAESAAASLEISQVNQATPEANAQVQLIDLVDDISILTSDSASETLPQIKALRARTPSSKQAD